MIVRVAINIPSDKTFQYFVPESLRESTCIGKRVLVPFGRRRTTGYILELSDVPDIDETKDVIDILDNDPLFGEEDLAFYRWMSRYYMYPLGKALKNILPGGIDIESAMWLTSTTGEKEYDTANLSPARRKIIEAIASYPSGLSAKKLQKEIGKNNIYEDIRALQRSRLIAVEDRIRKPDVTTKREKIASLIPDSTVPQKLTEKQKTIIDLLHRCGSASVSDIARHCKNPSSTLRSLEKKGVIAVEYREVFRSPDTTPRLGKSHYPLILTEEQEEALTEIIEGITSRRYSPYLLHGVTGSGKTEVYFRAIEAILKTRGSVIYLVPEIALTPQLLSRIKDRFDNNEIAILHSGISRRSKYDEWRRIRRGEARIIVGARSAIFAPARNLRLVIVDEEHDSSYKQDERLTYNARNLAVVKAKFFNATVVLGSATPGIQTYYNSLERDFRYLSLTKRIDDRPLPQIAIVDMKEERDTKGNVPILSRALKKTIGNTLRMKQQTLLFLNRRGFTTFLHCLDCGYIFKCVNCSVSMTHHSRENILKCHYCNYTVQSPPVCPQCRGFRINSYGVGTEKVEDEIKELFPDARVERMDSDTTQKRGTYVRILRALDRGDIDILIGTQMITKGHDYPNVTLVGVISADTSLNLPDFRASERTFQLLTQVSGRGGRGDAPGKVVIQTFNPEHYAIRRAHCHDCPGFYHDEIALRRQLRYPPFSRMVNFRISGTHKDRVVQCARNLETIARELSGNGITGSEVRIMGPAEAPIARIKGRHRWQMLLVGENITTLHGLTRDILSKAGRDTSVIKVDVDPMNFM